MRDPRAEDCAALAESSVYLLAPATSPLWNGHRKAKLTSYQPNRKAVTLILPQQAGIWFPKYPKDWKSHPHVHRALSILYYLPREEKLGYSLSVTGTAPNKIFMHIPPEWVRALIDREREASDLYAWLVKTHPNMS